MVVFVFHCWITFNSFWATFGLGTKPSLSQIWLKVSGPDLGHIKSLYSMRARSGTHQYIRVILQGVGRIWARGNCLSRFSVWASFGPGTQPELGQKWSKVVAHQVGQTNFAIWVVKHEKQVLFQFWIYYRIQHAKSAPFKFIKNCKKLYKVPF